MRSCFIKLLFIKRFGVVFLALTISACQPSANQPSDEPFVIDDKQVYLHKSHLIAVKNELFQPSFALQGVILPKEERTINAPNDGQLSNLAITLHQSVSKDAPLVDFHPKITSYHPAPSNESKLFADAPSTTEIANNTPNDNDTADTAQKPNTHAKLPPTTLATNDLSTHQPSDDTPSTDNELSNKPTNDSLPTLVASFSYGAPITLRAPISGTISALHVNNGEIVQRGSVICTISDTSRYQFVSVLPLSYKNYLHIGDNVNFTVASTTAVEPTDSTSFAGQIADVSERITADSDTTLAVTVHLLPQSDHPLNKGMSVQGWIDYDDLQVGAVVPSFAIADGVNLATLKTPPHKPPTPMPAHVWIIRQDGTLARTDVKIVAYKPAEQRYLVTGISADSLIVTANLPANADGKRVVVR